MHEFMMGAVLHTIVVAVVAFFVLFAASKADGFVRLLGVVLGWILLLGAAAGLIFGIYCGATGHQPPWDGHPGWMMRWHNGAAGGPPAAPQPPAQVTPPAQPTPPKSK